jgi:hypothetical protein
MCMRWVLFTTIPMSLQLIFILQLLQYLTKTVNVKWGNSGNCQTQALIPLLSFIYTNNPALKNCVTFSTYRQFLLMNPISSAVGSGYQKLLANVYSIFYCTYKYSHFTASTENLVLSCFNSVSLLKIIMIWTVILTKFSTDNGHFPKHMVGLQQHSASNNEPL